jgi:hypothetical protein
MLDLAFLIVNIGGVIKLRLLSEKLVNHVLSVMLIQ